MHMKLKRGRRRSKSIQTLPNTTLLSATYAQTLSCSIGADKPFQEILKKEKKETVHTVYIIMF